MKKNFKSMATILVCFFVMSTMLCACASQPTGSSAAATTPSDTETSSPTATVKEPAQDKLEPAVLTFYNLGSAAVGNKEMFAKINEKLQADINATVNFEYLDWSDWATRYPLLFAANEDFDAIYTSNWAFYGDQAKKGGFLELTDEMLTKYAPLTKQNVTDDMWSQTKINGKVYMVPMTDKAINALVFIIRGDLREKYGLGEIKTKDNLLAYWDAVAANEKDIYPIGLGNGSSTDDAGSWIYQNFTAAPNSHFSANYFNYLDTTFYSVEIVDGKVQLVDGTELAIQDYQLLNSFRKKGYWSQNALNQADPCTTLFTNGKSASACHAMVTISNMYVTTMKDHPEWKPEIVDVTYTSRPVQANPATNNGIGIHVNSKNPERALMVIDRFNFDRDYYDLIHYGEKGVYWDSDNDTDITFLSVPEDKTYSGYGMPFTSHIWRYNTVAAPNYTSLMKTYIANSYTPTLALFSFDNSKVVNEESAINAVNLKYKYILQLGFSEDITKTMQDWKKELDSAGWAAYSSEYITQAQAFVDSYGK